MSNRSFPTEFLLLPFADTRELQLLHFALFLGIYLAALLGNGLILTAIACDHRLHTPMYFFLLNLALFDLGTITTTVPKAMANSLCDTRAISYAGCATQVFMFVAFVTAEFYLLTFMAYDRYIAICKPLHYGTIMANRSCITMAAVAWGAGVLSAVLHTANTFSLPLCQCNALDQFFCELPQILKLSCSDAYLRELGFIIFCFCSGIGYFIFIVLSYVQIFRAVLRIPSKQGRHKTFSTCLPHLAVVSLFLSTVMFTYLKPSSASSPSIDLLLAVLYSVVPPAVNPLIYSMKNKELKDVVRKLVLEMIFTAWSKNAATRRLQNIKKNFMSFGKMLKGSRAQVVSFSILPVGDWDPRRPPVQKEEVNEAFFRQLKVASESQALVLMGDFNHPGICWEDHTARHEQSRRFLQCIDDNFMTQVVEKPTRRCVLLDLVVTNEKELVEDVRVGGSPGCSDHNVVELRIL
ncbi:olfactory receptor 14A16-like [Aythya fuligula]|uniref:Olfactory receptor 14A16-like n=1 Tax=Aythya fuligula TaxID=219594 RepID=A0A6J3EBB1_AYTFU|nr:olfactory receptor 14A16-like [Aythya fuligula]